MKTQPAQHPALGGLVGAGRVISDNQVEVTGEVHREWCKRRAYFVLNKGNLGCFGNSIGQLCADLMRHKDTIDLLDNVGKIRTEEELRNFLEYL